MTHSSNHQRHQHLSPWSTITSLSHMFNFKLDVSIWRIATRASHTNTKIATLPEADLGALSASDVQCSGLTTHPTQSTIRVVNLKFIEVLLNLSLFTCLNWVTDLLCVKIWHFPDSFHNVVIMHMISRTGWTPPILHYAAILRLILHYHCDKSPEYHIGTTVPHEYYSTTVPQLPLSASDAQCSGSRILHF